MLNDLKSILISALLSCFYKSIATDPVMKKVYDSYSKFKQDVSEYHEISEDAFVEARQKGGN